MTVHHLNSRPAQSMTIVQSRTKMAYALVFMNIIYFATSQTALIVDTVLAQILKLLQKH